LEEGVHRKYGNSTVISNDYFDHKMNSSGIKEEEVKMR
jgi:hypothetical protein